MPFKNVSSVRKVASVEGAVTGGAFNRALSAVAISSNNPVQIALLPLNGVNPKIQSVGLDDVTDIALLNRAMAIVKAGDATWALLDIEHKPKVEQLHPDTKAICPKAAGNLALGLKWDGSGVEYSPGKTDVAMRDFQLRGDTRCADVGENETYVVVDGGEGEFRIHPGTTPESGSATKCALPAGCKNLDRIKGAKHLSAIYKRGNPNVCIVRRAGNRLEAKMLSLGWPPTDVAVVETTMLVTTADGRIVLFDAESLHMATTSFFEARLEAHIGCRGEPRVMVVANQTLFVGTSTGEILQGAIVRKQAMA
jgi:hypothetical protein